QNLEILRLRLNKISQLPSWFNQLKNLKALDLANNAFEHIPSVLLDLNNLQVVSLANPEKYDEKLHPFGFSANKIDYLKNIDLLIKLLSLENMKKVHIEVQDDTSKIKIMNILKERGLDKKIEINIASNY
ncbi:MAG: leucine-rich repeat domain-containing protein, partial [Bacteroidales bacterium]